jgi:hypothetical protein
MKCVPKKTMTQERVQESDIAQKEVKTPAARFGCIILNESVTPEHEQSWSVPCASPWSAS